MSAVFVAVVMLVLSAFAWWQRGEAQRNESRALASANELTAALEVQANLIWRGLEFSEGFPVDLKAEAVDVLWYLSSGGPGIREPFLKELASNHPLVRKLAQRPELVISTLGLRLSPEETQVVLTAVLDEIKGTSDPEALSQLLATIQILPVQLTAEQALRPLGSVLDAFIDKGHEASPLLEHIKVLAARVTPEKVQVAAGLIIDVMRDTKEPDALWRVVQALKGLPVQLTPEQGRAALDRILDVARDTTSSYSMPSGLLPLSQALEALPVQPAAEETQLVTGRILNALRNTATEHLYMDELAQAAQAAGSKRTTEQAKTEFREQVQAALGDRFLGAMRGTTDPEALKKLVGNIQRLPVQLPAEQLQAALGRVLDVIRDKNDPNALQSLLEALKDLPVQLTDHQAQALLARVLDVVGSTTNQDWRLKIALDHFASKLTDHQAQAALGQVLNAMRSTSNADALQTLARAVQKIAPRLTVDQAQAALGQVPTL